MRQSVLLVILVAASLGARAAQQPQSKPPSPPPQFRGGANLVRVDIFATHNGTPVQSLTQADFEVLEDGKPQTIDSFQHVVVPPADQTALIEPNSVRDSLQQVADPHHRVFVIFLDTENVDLMGSHNIRKPLIDMLNHLVGPDDLVGVMTPTMSPDQITFGRKTEVIADGLTKNWIWGRQGQPELDDQEQMYASCFPPQPGQQFPSPLARQLIQRRRERMTLDSIRALVRYMSNMREGRTAVITVSPGWELYRPDENLTTVSASDRLPGTPPPVGVGPGGTMTTKLPGGVSDLTECDRDRMDLAMTDDQQYFADILGEANRTDVSFYTIDPRGLSWSSAPPDSVNTEAFDAAMTRGQGETLKLLSLETGGLALLNNNDLVNELRQISDDLTSYYLIGYYSTNTKLDGKYRLITVHVKPPGVEVRARKGYRAPTEADMKAVATAAASGGAKASDKAAIATALGEIDLDAHGSPPAHAAGEPALFHRGPTTGNQLQPAPTRTFSRSDRLHLELEAASGSPAWTGALLDRNGRVLPIPIQTGERLDPSTGQRWLTADLTLAPLGAGDYIVQLTRADGSKTLTAIQVTQ